MVDMVDTTLSAMPWLKESDTAVAGLSFKYAQAIDAAAKLAEDPDRDKAIAGMEALTKALYLGPHLLKTLAALGGTPADRKALAEEGHVGGKLSSLRAKRAQRQAAEGGEAAAEG